MLCHFISCFVNELSVDDAYEGEGLKFLLRSQIDDRHELPPFELTVKEAWMLLPLLISSPPTTVLRFVTFTLDVF